MKIKMTLVLAFILCLALSAFAQDEMKKDDKMSKKMTPDQMLMNQEQMAWSAIKAKRWEDFGKMLADDYQGVSADGISNKTATLANITKANLTNAELSDIKVAWIDKDAAIVTAIVKVEGANPEGKTETENIRTVSVWRKNGKSWQVVYHTDMEMKPEEMMK